MTDTARAPTKPMPGLVVTLYEDDDLLVSRVGDVTAATAVLCFTGIGLVVDAVQPNEFVGSAALPDSFALHVTDKKRSWFNGFPPERLLDVIAPLVTGKTIVTLGNSMGGFGAIWIARYLPVATAIAFAPQYSVHPEIVPGEKRWMPHRRNITAWRVPSLLNGFAPPTRFYTFNSPVDREHWTRFPIAENGVHILMPQANHNLSLGLKKTGVLRSVIEAAVNRAPVVSVMRAAGIRARRLVAQ